MSVKEQALWRSTNMCLAGRFSGRAMSAIEGGVAGELQYIFRQPSRTSNVAPGRWR